MLTMVRSLPVSLFQNLTVSFSRKGFARRIVGIPKAESDAILSLLFRQVSENPDFQVRFKWQTNSVAIWDNRVIILSKLSTGFVS